MSSILLDVDESTRTAIKALSLKIYENKSIRPSFEDILNCFYELKICDFASMIHDFASLIHQTWNAEGIKLGALIRGRFKQDFLEVSEIKAFEKLIECTELSETKSN